MARQKKTICIVSPFPPPLGGMAIQAGKLSEVLTDCGYNVIKVKTNADLPIRIHCILKIKGLRTILTVFFFLRSLNRELYKTDVVYFLTGFFDFFFWVTYPALLLIKLRKKRVILSVRGGGARRFFEKYQKLVAPVLRRVDVITAPSPFLRDVFKEFFDIEPFVIPNIADLEQFKYRERINLKPNMIVTRSLEDIYNVSCVVEAFKIICERFPQAKLGIVGSGTKRGEIEALVLQLGLSKHVTFYGRVEHSEIQHIYDRYDLFLNASRVDNFPGTILEAFSSGLPVVTTNPGGIPYLVHDGETGLLVKSDDCLALATAAVNLLEHPDKAIKLARAARITVACYSWAHIKSVFLDLLDGQK